MVTIGWSILLLVLLVGLGLDGVALGLLSGLGLGLLTFSLQPAPPPYDLIILHATWLILVATLEAVGFFSLWEAKYSLFVEKSNNYPPLLLALFGYGLVLVTGNRKLCYSVVVGKNGSSCCKPQLLIPLAIAAHMALLVSPLSISGILLILVVGYSPLSILNLVGMIGTISVGIIVASSLLGCLMADKWLTKLYKWCAYKNDATVVAASKDTKQVTFLFLLLLLAEALFLLVKAQPSALTALKCVDKIFPVRLPMFFALSMLSLAAIVMLSFSLKPAKILQTSRFRLGIQQFFIFLGLAWLLETLMGYDKACLVNLLHDVAPHYAFYLMVFLYLFLIDMPIVIWLFGSLCIESYLSIVTLAIWLVVIHSLAPVRYWISGMVKVYKQSSAPRKGAH